jgi:hypothetical protein
MLRRRDFLFAGAASLAACGHRPWEDPSPAWRRVTSAHFVVHTDTDAADSEALIDRLEDVHLAVAGTFFPGLAGEPIHVLFFDRSRDFRALAPKDAAGFATVVRGAASERVRLLVFPTDPDFEMVASLAAHELAHGLLFALDVRVPHWLHEGFAKYVGALELSDALVIFDNRRIHGGYAFFADPVPIAKLIVANYNDFHGATELGHYMTAWFLVRMLLTAPGPEPAARIRTLAHGLAGAATPAATVGVVEAAFGMKLAAIDAEVRRRHELIVVGVGQPVERRTLAKTLVRGVRQPPRSEPDDRQAIRELCLALKRP